MDFFMVLFTTVFECLGKIEFIITFLQPVKGRRAEV